MNLINPFEMAPKRIEKKLPPANFVSAAEFGTDRLDIIKFIPTKREEEKKVIEWTSTNKKKKK